jgi:hypothetical protein
MSDAQTTRLALPLLIPGQAHKELFHNEALTLLDHHCHLAVEDFSSDPENVLPTSGQSWIIGSGALGAWSGKEGAIACWTAGGWRFIEPVVGMMAYIISGGFRAAYTGGQWNVPLSYVLPTGGNVIDIQARSGIESIFSVLAQFGLVIES